jgi:hypothetical protein
LPLEEQMFWFGSGSLTFPERSLVRQWCEKVGRPGRSGPRDSGAFQPMEFMQHRQENSYHDSDAHGVLILVHGCYYRAASIKGFHDRVCVPGHKCACHETSKKAK